MNSREPQRRSSGRPKKKEHQHVDEHMPEARVQEHVGERAPRTREDSGRPEGEPFHEEARAPADPHEQEDRGVGDQQPLHPRREGGGSVTRLEGRPGHAREPAVTDTARPDSARLAMRSPQFAEGQPGGASGPREQAGGGEPRKRVRLQAPWGARGVQYEVDPAEALQPQDPVHRQRLPAESVGDVLRDAGPGRSRAPSPADTCTRSRRSRFRG